MYDTRAFEGITNLYGKEAFQKIKKAHILIIGIGGVGSWVAEGFARSGVQNISLMDMDEICVSNINRQIHALATNTGEIKTEAMSKRLKQINPQINCVEIFEFFSEKTQAKILEEKYDFIIDAIDSVNAKALLHDIARRNNLSIICIGASGGRVDPTLIKVDDLNRSINDKLLKQLKKKLRRDYSFSKFTKKPFKIPTVFSSEIAKEAAEQEECELKSGRIKNCQSGLGSASFVTASFAFTAVAYVLNQLVKK